MRIFLDANILFSASNPKSLTHDFIRVLFRQATCLSNAYAIEEARRNLAKLFPEHLPNFENLLSQLSFISAIAGDLIVELETKDQPILGGAVAGRATHLLTGDRKHFGALFGETIQGVKIVDQARLAAELVESGLL